MSWSSSSTFILLGEHGRQRQVHVYHMTAKLSRLSYAFHRLIAIADHGLWESVLICHILLCAACISAMQSY